MTTDQSTELIWHFIGYLHIEELLNKASVSYSGAYIPTDREEYVSGSFAPDKVFKPGSPQFDKIKKITFNPDSVFDDVVLKLPRAPDVPGPISTQNLIELADQRASVFIPKTSVPVEYPDSDFRITVSYTYGQDQHQFLEIDQRNFLSNNDVLLSGSSEGIVEGHNVDTSAILASMLEDARDVFSQMEVSALEQSPEEIAAYMRQEADQIWSNAELEWAEYVEETGDTDAEMPYPGTVLEGQYVNGELVPDDDGEDSEETPSEEETDPGADDVADNPDFYPGDETETASGGVEAQGQDVHITTSAGEPTGGAAQIASLGGNSSSNTALITDYAEGYGSIIVLGDVYETNAIFQVNVLSDVDSIDFTGDGDVLFANSHNNTADNIAEFTIDNDTLVGNPAFGNIPVGANWNVDYIEGDFYDISIIIQYNELSDNDVMSLSTTNTNFVVVLGENTQIDLAQIANYGEQYDLIIIGGNVYELNVIAQVNLVLDDDTISVDGDGNWDSSQSADAGGNALLNDAAIINVGGGEYNELTDDAAELAELIGNMETDIDPALAMDIPGNGTGELNVLYISGDFYDVNAIYQVNIIADVDLSIQSMDDDQNPDGDADGNPEFTQDVETGGNSGTNSAVIIDIDSTSDYQFLGGNYYQNDMLVQANLLEDDDLPFDDSSEFLEDVLDLLVDYDGDDADIPLPDSDDSNTVMDDGDVIGSIIG